MNPASVVDIAAGASALTSIVITILNIALVRAARDSIRQMSAQTREVMNGRLDARAPRVIVRDWTVLPSPMATLRSGGRSTRPVDDQEINKLAHEGRVDMPLSVVVSWTVANEGTVTARVELPQGVVLGEEDNPAISQQVFLPPGSTRSLVGRVEASLGEWLKAAQDRTPVRYSFMLVVGDGFADGVRDSLRIAVEAYLIVLTSAESDPLSGAIEARLAANLDTRVLIHPVTRKYI